MITEDISENIGPGQNSLAVLRIDRPENAGLSSREVEYLRGLLRQEDGESIRTLAYFLEATRNIRMTLHGAHHEIEVLGHGGEENEEEYSCCIFCGARYAWKVRCMGNTQGDL